MKTTRAYSLDVITLRPRRYIRGFRTFAMNVSQIYDGEGDPVEMNIDLEPTSKVAQSGTL